jgi:hypothetical protein
MMFDDLGGWALARLADGGVEVLGEPPAGALAAALERGSRRSSVAPIGSQAAGNACARLAVSSGDAGATDRNGRRLASGL